MSRHVRIALNLWPFVFGALLILGLARYEQAFNPVITSFSVTEIIRDADGLLIAGTMVKDRACDFIGVTAKADPNISLAIKFMDDDTPGTFSRPTGSQSWGPWKIFTPLAPKINTITLTASHACHPFWVTRTEMVNIVINGG